MIQTRKDKSGWYEAKFTVRAGRVFGTWENIIKFPYGGDIGPTPFNVMLRGKEHKWFQVGGGSGKVSFHI